MKSLKRGVILLVVTVLGGALATACHPTFVVVPYPDGDTLSSLTDTVRVRDDYVVVTFRVDTLFRVDTVLTVDSLFLDGTDTLYVREVHTDTVVRVDTLMGVDTVRVAVTDTLYQTRTVVRTDTVLRVDTVAARDAMVFVDTVIRVDTIRTTVTDTVLHTDTVVRVAMRVDTVQVTVTDTVLHTDTVIRVDTIRVAVTDTVMRTDTLTRVDTVRVAVTDTVVRVDTVRVAGQRLLFLPPGHEPPQGQCRIWVYGLPPGQQARAAPCDALGAIPEGAFILFGGEAWDFDYDWLAVAESDPGSVPPQIIALQRRAGRN